MLCSSCISNLDNLVNKIKESGAGVKSRQRVGETERESKNNLSSAIPLREGPLMFQDIRFLFPIPSTAGYEISAENENAYAPDRLKADPNKSRRKRQRIIKSNNQPSSQSKFANNQDLSSWLEKSRNDKDTSVNHATASLQPSSESSESDLPSTRKSFTKSFNTASSCENVLPISTSSTSKAQGSSIGFSDGSEQLAPTCIFKEDCKVMTKKKMKMLKLNKMGKLRSPELSNGMGNQLASPKLVVVLKYGREEEIRRRVAEIIDKTLEACTSISKSEHSDKEVDTANQAKSDKSVHPFFTNRQKLKSNADTQCDHEGPVKQTIYRRDESQFRKCAVTPGKLRAQRQDCIEETGHKAGSNSHLNISTQNSNKSRANCYSWPSKANLHIRGLEDAKNEMPSPRYTENHKFRENRKLKGSFITISRSDNTIIKLSEDLRCYTNHNKAAALQDCASWRNPTREVTTGPDLVNWFSQELLTSKNATNPRTQQGGDAVDNENFTMHPALEKLYNETENTLTPFDEFACESIPWASKYSPRTADQVLQLDNQAQVLRNWLRSLALQMTQNRKSSNIASNIATNHNSILRRTRPKKRRKLDRLEGFIASSDEESNDREELSETASNNSSAILKDRSSKLSSTTSGCDNLSNAVLISGPHGCGKTAAVYAAAEELGFEVFEVNSGSRRTGKDLLDKVGEMAETHLVQPVKDLSVSSKIGELGTEELLAAKSNSVSQKSMKSFFETKTKPAKSKNTTEDNQRSGSCKDNEQVRRSTPRQQKQSLILLEEADVLFDKDKQFWPTVVSLLAYSKRPVVVTCTDERFIPRDLIKFQEILQFTPPPRDTTIDYLMLLAGKEGHKLSRDALSSIFDQTNQDLRACIMTLNFWCQMAVGDKKGGLEWMVNRWPAGIDLDRFGRKLRVVSNNTYWKGMNLIPSDLCFAKNSVVFNRDCELLRDAYNDRRVDLELLYDTFKRRQSKSNLASGQHLRQESGSIYQQLADAQIMSDAWSFADCFMKEVLLTILKDNLKFIITNTNAAAGSHQIIPTR